MRIFDTHTHYMSEQFDENRQELLQSLPGQGVAAVLDCGVDYETTLQSLAYGQAYPWLYTAAGVHPQEIGHIAADEVEKLEKLLAHPKVLAVGECGLDYHYEDGAAKELQKEIFAAELTVANRHDMPIVVHSRDATQDTMELLRQYKPKGVMHCFSGSAETAREVVKLGMYVGFTGVITFKNARKVLQALEAVPLEHLLIETDCPWMAPEPLRGRSSHSGMLVHTAAKAAEIKGVTLEELLEITYQNACRMLGLPLC
ncbi:TatD family hydrolase [Ruminococcaceae bacterium OttesenSCG-928-N02]|nr:TatD family hydrolase [Ruminococcaceae bacterium OttesenSCG-928-N02]